MSLFEFFQRAAECDARRHRAQHHAQGRAGLRAARVVRRRRHQTPIYACDRLRSSLSSLMHDGGRAGRKGSDKIGNLLISVG
jgi:hypothetical protein